MKSLLILEDDVRLATSLAREFEDQGYQVCVAHQIKEIPNKSFEFAITDMRLGGEMGLDAISILHERSPACRIVVLSGYGSINTAVEAVKRGAIDYVTKPTSFSILEAALLGQRVQEEVDFKAPSLSQVEHEYIDFVLLKNKGNISKTAKALGLHRQSLQRKLKKYT